MSFADGLIKVADKLLNTFNVTDRVLYKRVFTRTGGDALIGRPGTVTHVDTLISPPPAVEIISDAYLSLAVGSTSLLQIGDYALTFSANSITRAELQNKNLALVFTPGATEEELMIVTFEPLMANGKDVAFEVVARSKKR
jgi:hypothetical protein